MAYCSLVLPKFGNLQSRVYIEFPRRIVNPQLIEVGDDVYLGPDSVLVSATVFEKNTFRQEFTPFLKIGSRVFSTSRLQIYCFSNIEIGDDVLIASNVLIEDALHSYGNTTVPFKEQGFSRLASVHIGRGSWIGQNVVINPGVTIGEFCIIGANSVVTKSIPARCIAVGVPARVMKKWDEESESWIAA